MTKRSSSELVDDLAGLAEEIRNRAVSETRRDVADALRDQFIDRGHTACTYHDTPQDSIIGALRHSEAIKGPLQALADRFDDEGVPADFRLGLQFAIAMIRDSEFEL